MQAVLTIAGNKTLPARIAHIQILWQILQNKDQLISKSTHFLSVILLKLDTYG